MRTLSEALGLEFRRIQFTPDLMPSDITGTDIIEEDPTTGRRTWTFVPGPIFANVLLADEINRTPPKTQSALLEAMQERSCTVRGNQYNIKPPFFVLATQNPIELEGTYPLPEAQLDRFIFNMLLDYLSADDELKVLDLTTTTKKRKADAVTTAEEILDFQQVVRMVPIADSVARYAVNLVRATRATDPCVARFRQEVRQLRSQRPRRAILSVGAKARALMHRRYHVTYEDVIALMQPILRHRILLNFQAESDHLTQDDILRKLLEAMPAPERSKCRRACRSPHAAAFLDPTVLAGISGLDLVAKTVSMASSPACTARPISDSARSSPNTAPTRPATICGTSIGTSSRAPNAAYLKRYRGETNCQLTILLDCSRSMKFGSRKIDKLEYARFLAASLATWRIMQRDAAGLIVFRRRSAQFRAALDAPGPVRALAARDRKGRSRQPHRLSRSPFSHVQRIPAPPRPRRRDFRFLGTAGERSLRPSQPLRFHGNEVVLFHVLDPEEIRPEAAASGAAGRSGNRRHDGSFARLRGPRISSQDRRASGGHRSREPRALAWIIF